MSKHMNKGSPCLRPLDDIKLPPATPRKRTPNSGCETHYMISETQVSWKLNLRTIFRKFQLPLKNISPHQANHHVSTNCLFGNISHLFLGKPHNLGDDPTLNNASFLIVDHSRVNGTKPSSDDIGK